VVSLEFLLQMFFKAIDPTSLNMQGHDEGTRYRTGIYYTDPADLPIIEKVFAEEGVMLGLFTQCSQKTNGYVDIDWFEYSTK
jgi:peptide methionine sulfoxide reductase MsrA